MNDSTVFEIASRHKKGFLVQRLQIRATDPDDACNAAYNQWDMQDRVIVSIRRHHTDFLHTKKMQRLGTSIYLAFLGGNLILFLVILLLQLCPWRM